VGTEWGVTTYMIPMDSDSNQSESATVGKGLCCYYTKIGQCTYIILIGSPAPRERSVSLYTAHGVVAL
jgi:hypothetical protein